MRISGAPAKPDGTHRMLAIGDSHGHTGMLLNACDLAAAVGADEIWSVGDFGVWPGRVGARFLDDVEEAAERTGTTVRVVPGNHDDYDQIDDALARATGGWAHLRPHVTVARRGHVHRIGRARIMCFSGAASIDGPGGIWGPWRGPGDGWWEQERITDADVATAKANIAAAGGAVDLMICHDLPSSRGVVGQVDFPLGEEIRRRIAAVADHGRAPVLLAGHWHRHIDRQVDGRREIVLSADVNPTERQWAVVDVDPNSAQVDVHLPVEWDEGTALS